MNYGRLSTNYYNLSKPFPPDEELKFYLETLRKINGKILEPMCGSGRFLFPLLEAGFEIDGFDTSSDMIKILQKRLQNSARRPKISNCDFKGFHPDENYKAIIIPSGSFGLLTDSHQAITAIEKMYEWLEPGGCCILEIDTWESRPCEGSWIGKAMEISAKEKISIQGNVCHTKIGYDNEIVYRKFLRESELEVETEMFQLRLYSHSEFSALIDTSSFGDVNFLHSYKSSTYNTNLNDSFIAILTKKDSLN
jgi:SAM-dependent methyltransferase